jgi:hypothetical protein
MPAAACSVWKEAKRGLTASNNNNFPSSLFARFPPFVTFYYEENSTIFKTTSEAT